MAGRSAQFLPFAKVMKPNDILRITERGLYCEAGGFYIDPWLPVDYAVITHAHGDHARWGSKSYACSAESERVLRTRVGGTISARPWGERFLVNGVTLSFHPAGHILGSAQIRVEYQGETWVASGDYKTEPDPTCTPFEPVRCDVFITESTFGLPIYRWPLQSETFAEMAKWWKGNREAGKASVVFAYSLGKAQRVLAGLAEHAEGGILHARCGGAIESRLPRRGHRAAAHHVRVISGKRARLVWSTHRRATIGSGLHLASALWNSVHRICIRMDARSRGTSQACGRSRFRSRQTTLTGRRS